MGSMCGFTRNIILLVIILGITGCTIQEDTTYTKMDISTESDITEEIINKEGYILNYCISRDSNGNKINIYNKGDKITIISKLSDNKYKINTDEYIDIKHIGSSDTIFIDNNFYFLITN